MLKTISAHEVFANAKANALFALYMEADKHAAVTEAPAQIVPKEGEPFNLYGGFCFGENLHIIPNQLIIQTWRVGDWSASQPDSILLLRFVEIGKDTHLFMTHADVPEDQAESLSQGWDEWYWQKWRQFLMQGQ